MSGGAPQLSQVGWLAASLASAAGAGLAVAVCLRAWRLPAQPPAGGAEAEPSLEVTEAQLADCLDALRDLNLQAARLREADVAQSRRELEAQAASLAARRARLAGAQSRGRAARVARAQSEPRRLRRARIGGALWGAGAASFAAWLIMGLGSSPGPGGGAPGPVAGASVSEAPQAQGGAKLAEIRALGEAVKAEPTSLAKTLALAHALLREQFIDEAREVNARALRLDPTSPEGLVHEAVLRAAQGDAPGGMAFLDAFVRDHPDFSEAWFFRGMLAMQAADTPKVAESFRRFVDTAPPGAQRDRVAKILEDLL